MRRWWVGCLVLGACAAEPTSLVVQLKTDFVPGVEFAATEVHVGEREVRGPALRGDPYLDGVRIAEIEASGEEVLVRLLDPEGGELTSRTVRREASPNAIQAITVLVSRSCLDVTCPGGESCFAGTCIAASCIDGTQSSCAEPECGADADCEAPAGCGVSICSDGACLGAPEATCATGFVCAPGLGCLADPDDPPLPLSEAESDLRRTDNTQPRANGFDPASFELSLRDEANNPVRNTAFEVVLSEESASGPSEAPRTGELGRGGFEVRSSAATVDTEVRIVREDVVTRIGPVTTMFGPVAYRSYSFDEGSGTSALDRSGGGRDGSFEGAVSYSDSGRFGAAIALDGATAVDLGYELSGRFAEVQAGQPFSVEAFAFQEMRNDSAQVVYQMGGCGNGVAIGFSPEGRALLHVRIQPGGDPGDLVSLATSEPLPLAQWVHLAGVVDDDSVRFYVDGVEVDSFEGSYRWATGNAGHYIGRAGLLESSLEDDCSGGADHFIGRIDEVQLHAFALAPAQVAADAGRALFDAR